MKLSLIIVNYNTESYICNLLQDLMAQTLPTDQWQVVIVNNSQNDKLEIMTQRFQASLSCTIIQSPQNVGFGRAMNLGATVAKGEHLLITNPDIRIHNPDFLKALLNHLERLPNYGVATCQILDDKGVDGSEFDRFEFGEVFDIKGAAWFLGAFLAIKSSIYQKIGGFNPKFFMYCEDQDICLRIHRIGLPLVKINELSVYHKGGSSESGKNYDYFYRMYRSNFLFAYLYFDEQKFHDLVSENYKKSKNNSKKYFCFGKIGLLAIHKYRVQQQKWLAIYDITKKIKDEGVDWLHFKPQE